MTTHLTGHRMACQKSCKNLKKKIKNVIIWFQIFNEILKHLEKKN